MTAFVGDRAPTGQPTEGLHVLVVDDSAVVRQLLSTILEQRGGMTVTTAADPLIAMRKMKAHRPDVAVLDLVMPRMDGLTFLRKLMTEDPLPVVICSSHAGCGSRAAMDALAQGAVDIVRKPSVGVHEFLRDSAVMLVDAVRAAALVRVRPRLVSVITPPPSRRGGRRPGKNVDAKGMERVVGVGVSTGGPAALEVLLGGLATDCPGLVIVQHMPEGFTAALARRLNDMCRIEVREARAGDVVTPGTALIAPGDRHLKLVRLDDSYTVDVVGGPLVSRHRPSVDVLCRSMAGAAGANGVGVIMTGMGHDGVEGLAAMKRAGAFTVAQDETSSAVFGMPRVAIERGCVDEVARLPDLAALLSVPRHCPGRRGSRDRGAVD